MTNANDPITLGSEVDRLGNTIKEHLGLTKREQFAAMAMHGFLHQNISIDRALNETNQTHLKYVCEASVMAADALINALNK